MKPKLQMIKINKEKQVIHWGELHTQDRFIRGLDWRYVSKTLGYTTGVKRSGTKKTNKALTELLGISPKKFACMLRGSQYSLWIKDKEDLISKLCVSYRQYSPDKISLLNRNFNVVSQYKKDGLDHLIPLAMYTGLSTKELKSKLGKSTWKSFCNNSFYRNKLICQQCGPYIKVYELIGESNYWFNKLKKISTLPSSAFRYQNNGLNGTDEMFWGINVLKENKMLCRKDELSKLIHLYNDTQRMSKKLDEPFNPRWSFKRMQEMHNLYTDYINREKYSDKFIECLRDIPVKEYHRYGLVAKLLVSPLQIISQGQSQHHCVGSYVDNVKRGGYLVYSINDRDTNEIISTLGIYVRDAGENFYVEDDISLADYTRPIDQCEISVITCRKRNFTLSQHYMKYNKPVQYFEENPLFSSNQIRNRLEVLADEIIQKLNREQICVDK